MVQISLQNVSRSFGSEVIFSDVTAKIEDHDRIGLVGPNGTGKTTLLRVICGELEPDDGSGEIARGADLSIGYQKQNCGLSFEGTIWQEMQSVFADVYALERRMKELQERMAQENTPALAEEYRRTEDAFLARDGYQIEVKIKTVLTGMGFAEHGFDKCVDKLSGGEQTRLAIAKLLLEAPSLLILDEPTNHLDFATLSWLEDYLASYKGALLVVSHDRYFLDKLSNKIWELEDGTLWEYKGNYTAYTRQREEQDTRQKKLYEQQQAERAKLEDYVARNLVRASTTKMAQSRQKMLERLERSFDMEKQFTSDASHELRTPTAVIISQCEYAQEHDATPEEFQDTIAIIKRQARRMNAMVSQLLSFARMEQGTQKVKLEHADISGIVEAVCEEQAELNPEVDFQCAIDPGICSNVDITLMSRLVENLITNACKFGGKHVKVGLYEEDGQIYLFVRDDGIGISPENQKKVWDRFWQAEPSRSDNRQGSNGLGLSMVREIAKIHRGEMSLQSAPRQGSTFTLKMPKE